MKKILYILLTVFIGFSCKDFNEDNFDWYEDAEKPTNVASYEFTMTDADYTIIVNALKATGVEENIALANKLNSAKKFTPELSPQTLIPYLLEKKYLAMDVKSSAKVTYLYDEARGEVVSGLSGAGHILAASDYKLAWGSDLYASSLNPQKTPDAKLPLILAANYTTPEEGDYATLEYNYSTENSVTSVVESTPVYLSETFEGYATNATAITGWINKDTSGAKAWQVKSFNSNLYMQMSSNGSGEKNTVWLISPKVDLETATTPYLTFFVTAGYYNADCLSVKISTDFNGTEAGITSATWTDVTSKFTLPKAPTSGYGTLSTAGMGDLSAYKGKKVYVAFKYDGDATSTPVKTTTFQIDNVKVCEATVGIDVPNKAPQYASYTYSGGAWKKVGSNIIVLQPADYAKLEITTNTMTAAQAKDLLPQYLVKNAVGVEGTEKVLVYRTKAGEFYADKYTYKSGVWVLNTTLSQKTSQYVYAQLQAKKAWIFDPTIIIPMSKPDYQLIVDYVKEHYYEGNEAVWDTRGNAEYYFGFSQYYGNISYREAGYRDKDKTYPMSGTQEEKLKFMNDRTKQAFMILLTLKYPNATPVVSGVDQKARFDNIVIYSEPNAGANVTWSYTFQCIGNKEWKFLSRESNDGRSEVAK